MENQEEVKVTEQRLENNQVPTKNKVKIKNKIANKFKLVVTLLKFLGYGGAIISALIIILASEMELAGIVVGLLVALVVSLITWFSCLSWEAIAEVLQLLEDIKNK